MKQICFALTTCLLLLASGTTRAQTADEMKKWMDYMTPSDVHKMIAESDGEWKEEIQSWMAPNTPPTAMVAYCTNKMIMGGRYQVSTQSGDMGGMPFEGQSLLAYDNIRKIFITTWIDNMGTGIIVMEGTWDEKSKTITFTGKATDPFSGKLLPVRQVFTFVDADTQKMVMYNTTAEGVEFKSLEMTLTRKK